MIKSERTVYIACGSLCRQKHKIKCWFVIIKSYVRGGLHFSFSSHFHNFGKEDAFQQSFEYYFNIFSICSYIFICKKANFDHNFDHN